jgi:hypothetical protein
MNNMIVGIQWCLKKETCRWRITFFFTFDAVFRGFALFAII